MPDQPVLFSHKRHVGQLGIDCRYCHTHVDESPHSNVPDVNTCINCHAGDPASDTAFLSSTLWGGNRGHKNNVGLKLVRESYAGGEAEISEPIQWRRIHKLPDYAHFNHAAHINAGVSCYSCHGRIDQMAVVYQSESLSMGWCLDCHRNPEPHLVNSDGILADEPTVRITDLSQIEKLLQNPAQAERGKKLAEARHVQPPEHCFACHY
jgi:hypothetical protein